MMLMFNGCGYVNNPLKLFNIISLNKNKQLVNRSINDLYLVDNHYSYPQIKLSTSYEHIYKVFIHELYFVFYFEIINIAFFYIGP